jgi:hypothetical protein
VSCIRQWCRGLTTLWFGRSKPTVEAHLHWGRHCRPLQDPTCCRHTPAPPELHGAARIHHRHRRGAHISAQLDAADNQARPLFCTAYHHVQLTVPCPPCRLRTGCLPVSLLVCRRMVRSLSLWCGQGRLATRALPSCTRGTATTPATGEFLPAAAAAAACATPAAAVGAARNACCIAVQIRTLCMQLNTAPCSAVPAWTGRLAAGTCFVRC